MADGWSEPRPLRSKDLLEVQRSQYKGSGKRSESRQNTGPLFKTPEMRIPSVIVTQSEFRLERPKELLERMERSRSASKVPPKKIWLTPENRQRTWEKPKTPPTRSSGAPNIGSLPLRSKELLEQQRSRHRNGLAAKSAYYQILSSPVRSQYREELLNTPEKRPAAVTSHSETRLERPRERLEPSHSRSASASKIPASREQRAGEVPKTPEMSCPCAVEPGWEVRPLRTKELLERERQASITRRTASTSKIETKRTKATAPVSSLAASRLLVPSIGFSYPKDPKACLTSAGSRKAPPKLTNTKRNLFHQKESLRQKLERITDEWQGMTEPQLRQLFLDFVNLCLPYAGAECSQLSRESYVNQLIEALQELQYPREVNKTWLWMPKSQKAMGQVLEILRFLLDFAHDVEKECLCVFPIVPDEKQIFEQAGRAFRLGQGCPKQKLEKYCTSSDIISLQQELENLKLQPQDPDPDPDLCSELHSLQQEKRRLQEELANCQAEIESLASESAGKFQVLGNLYMKNLSQGQRLGQLKERVKNQSCSIQDYGEMVDQLEELTHELQLHRLRLQEFGERLRLSKLKLKRCQREQKESIEAFNVRIRDYEYSLTSESSYPASLQLSSSATIADVKEVIKRLRERRVYIFAC